MVGNIKEKDMNDVQVTTEMEALKAKLGATWQAGDFSEIASAIARGATEFVSRLPIQPGDRVLDIACGNGNTVIPAARAGAAVTGIDIAPYLIEQVKQRARSEGIVAKFDVGDAEALPYSASSFDVVLTMFGAMFAPRPNVVVSEMVRACRMGGTIAMANWTPAGFIGQMFKTTGKYLSPPAGMPSPLLWGDEDTVRERLSHVGELKMKRRMIEFDFPFGPNDVVEHFRRFYGPTLIAFEILDPESRSALRNDLIDLWTTNNTSEDGSTSVLAEYLEIMVTRD